MNILITTKHDPAHAKMWGWTTQHRIVSMHGAFGSKVVGFFTPRQIERGAWRAPALVKIHTNTPYRGAVNFILQP